VAQIDVPKALATVKAGMPALAFPVADAASLLKQVQGRTFTGPLNGKKVTASAGVKHVPKSMFPFKSQADFDTKVQTLIARRATKKGFTTVGFTAPK
jgi:hypothetical protein